MNDSQPAWSPDGTKLVFVRHLTQPVPRGRTAMFLINADGSGERRLTPWNLNAGDHPDWSPDGHRILFRSNFYNPPENAVSNIYTIRPDGTGLTRLTHATAGDQYLSSSYSADGKWITFGIVRGASKDARAAVYVMRANGTGADSSHTRTSGTARPTGARNRNASEPPPRGLARLRPGLASGSRFLPPLTGVAAARGMPTGRSESCNLNSSASSKGSDSPDRLLLVLPRDGVGS